jgi:hypothetical protein
MKVIAMMAAERANLTPEGKFDLLGVIRNLNSPGFPTIHPHLDLAIMLETEVTDMDGSHDVRIDVVSEEESHMVASYPGSLQMNGHNFESDAFVRPIILPADNLRFPEPGIYSFMLYVDGSCEARWDIRLHLIREENTLEMRPEEHININNILRGDPVKTAIVTWMREQQAHLQKWGRWPLNEIVDGIGHKPSRVKVALADLAREKVVEKDGDDYGAGPLLQYQISSEMQNAQEARLRSLDADALAKDDRDYLLKAIYEAMERATERVKTIVPGSANVLPGFQAQLVIIRENQLYTATEDFSQQIFSMSYDELVQHIAQRILRGTVGRLH